MAHGPKHYQAHHAAHRAVGAHMYKKLALVGLALAVVTIFATSNLKSGSGASEPPPSLSKSAIGGSFVEFQYGSLQYQPNDVSDFFRDLPYIKAQNSVRAFVPAGTNYLYTNKETTMGEVLRGIDPSANRLILAYYSSGELGRGQTFYTYPKGPFGSEAREITASELNTFVIPANRGVIVMNEKDTVAYGLSPVTQMTPTALSVAANSSPLPEGRGGWVLLASNTSRISDMIRLYRGRVISAWTLNARNVFEKVENRDTFAMTDKFLVWLKLAPVSQTMSPKRVLVEYLRAGVSTDQWFEGYLLSEVNGDYTVELDGKLENTQSDPTYFLKPSTTDKVKLVGKKANVALLNNPKFEDLSVNQFVIVKSPKTGRHWNGKIFEKRSNGTLDIGYKDEGYANMVNITTSDLFLTLNGKVLDTMNVIPASGISSTSSAGSTTVAAPTHAQNLQSLSQYLKWQRVAGSETQDGTSGDLTVKYRVAIENFKPITDNNLRIELLKNSHFGPNAWNIVREGPYNIQAINGSLKLAPGNSSPNVQEQNDGSLLVKVTIAYPGIPLPSDSTEWGKVDVDLVFSDSSNTMIAISSKYVTESFSRPSPIVVAGDGEVYFRNQGPGMIPANEFKKIVFYSSGGQNATSLYNIFKDNVNPWWAGSDSNWYNLDVGSKNWLLYDKIGHNYSSDKSGHLGLPTIYAVSVPSGDQDWF